MQSRPRFRASHTTGSHLTCRGICPGSPACVGRSRVTLALTLAIATLTVTALAATTQAADPDPRQVADQVDAMLAQELFNGLAREDQTDAASASAPASSTAPTQSLAPRTNDQAFLRRVSLDLVGELPNSGDVISFVFDSNPTKRQELVDRLLADERYGVNWGRYWRDVIFYRRSDDRALQAAPACEQYLTEQFNAGTSWDKVATAFITATGILQEQGAAGIIASQMGQTEEITAEVSRIFMGVQIQCAQCHDHPTDRWKRQQFHELAAFFPRIGLRPVQTGMRRSFEIISEDRERPMRRKMNQGRRGDLEHFMPDLKDPSSQGTQMTPVFFVSGQKLAAGASDLERRQALASWLTSSEDPWFAKAIVNRIWGELVGEGFYEPVDDLGPDRKCSAPQTMDYLAAQFVAAHYDLKWLFRTIVATQAYQRESRPRRNPEQIPFTANCSQRLRSDQVFNVLLNALGVDGPLMRREKRQKGDGPRGFGGPRFQFSIVFGYDPSERRDEIGGSIPQALMLMNSPILNRGLNGRNPGSSLGKLLASTTDNEQVTLELFLRCLAREPSDAELATCLEYVRTSSDRVTAFEDLFWSLLNRTEFLHRN